MDQASRIWHRSATLLLAALVAVSLAGVAGAQQITDFFDIAGVDHEPSGSIVAELAVPQGVLLEPGRMTAMIDGVPRPVTGIKTDDPTPLSVVIAIDVSGSMLGSRLAAAQRAALDLIERLNADDRVAVVTFSTEPLVASEFTTNRAVTRSTLSALSAGGATALYGAVESSARLIEGAETEKKVLVLLSDGEDSGGSTVTRDQSIAAIGGSGAAVYSFALELETDIAVVYLNELATRTEGEFSEVADEQALGALFASLGRRLGADVSITVAVPPLAIGEHEMALRFPVEGEVVVAEYVFAVTNDGLLSLSVAAPAGDDEGEGTAPAEAGQPGEGDEGDEGDVIRLRSLLPLGSFDLTATVGAEEPRAFAATTDRILIDPWAFEPGPLTVVVRAVLGGQPAAEASISVDVPELAPQLTLEREGGGDARVLVASGRAQGVRAPVLRVLFNGEAFASSDEPVTAADGGESADGQADRFFRARHPAAGRNGGPVPAAGEADKREDQAHQRRRERGRGGVGEQALGAVVELRVGGQGRRPLAAVGHHAELPELSLPAHPPAPRRHAHAHGRCPRARAR